MIALRTMLPDRSGTPRELGSRLGRCVLWLAVAVVLLRGLSATFDRERGPTALPARAMAPAWPDDAARAYAIEFASAYLTIAPDDPAARMAAAELAASGIGTLSPPRSMVRPRPSRSSPRPSRA